MTPTTSIRGFLRRRRFGFTGTRHCLLGLGVFALVGTHGLHVTFGLIWILIMTSQVIIKGLTIPVASRFLRLGLFWHFLDIIWIGVFTFVYLYGVVR